MTDTSYLYQYFMEKSVNDKEPKRPKDDPRPTKRIMEKPTEKEGGAHE